MSDEHRLGLLSVVVPCYAEAGNLADLHAAVVHAAEPICDRLELIVVDDGSPDATFATATAIASEDPRVKVISFSRNFGKEAAMLAGLKASTGDAVVVMDGDLQHPPELLPALVEAFLEGHDQVVAKRSRRGDPWLRTKLSQLYYRMMNRLVDVHLDDGVGDFRLLSRRAVDAVVSLGEMVRFSKGLFAWVGFDTAVIEYENRGRGAGASAWTIPKLFNYGVDGAISFNSKPLRLGFWLGAFVVAMTAVYLGWLIVNVLTLGIDVPGYVTLVALVTGLGGVQLIGLGIIGEYIGRMYVEVKARPHYIVRGAVGLRRPEE